ncbi:winged helix-turn-helix domain-containing tetratricopeptide repeat protein [Bradyrhizobium liaoningense]|uniref:winged helix-turn-helix domain-containing tetratricopeptide repeat protein n=1 Tax=Bradyrhizobium liaoningense TaxID=43992 RepID=UPI001BA7A710|nr:winged helix-turn-helix domain-containing tetratricopeptide repeat protein [Bradyrhizobium liaoningense]MBR0714865.1 winged helix-turn-helix domain-containing protein [Bradyrhizobium liaoningense]
MRYQFEEYALDTDLRELRRGPDVVSIAPQVFDLLDYLISNRDRVVSKDDLINAIWSGRSVSDAALTTRLNAARTAIGDAGDVQRLIKTLPRRGFRFVGAVREADHPAGTATILDERPGLANPALALPDKPSIAVLPFQNMSGDPEQEYFADGMVEEITIALSRFKWLFVIARNSSFTFKGQAVDIKEVGRKLGVHYVLEGSVRKASGKVRIAGQLIDATTNTHIWADTFERDLTDIFALQDEVAIAVVSAIQPRLLQEEISMAARRPPDDLRAYDLFLRAMPHLYRATREGLAEGIRLIHRALELDPRLGFVASIGSLCHSLNITLGYSSDPHLDRKEAIRFIRLALSIDDGDPGILANVAVASAFMIGDPQGEMEMADRSVALNPNSFDGWLNRGWVYRIAGQPEEALRSFARANRLSPVDPLLHRSSIGMAMAYIELERFDDAIEAAKRSLRQNPTHSAGHRCLLCALAHLGRDKEARDVAAQMLELDPAFTISGYIARGGQANAKLLIEGFRKAGLPE